MESDLEEHGHFVQEHQQKQMNSGLTRYQSAPSSYFSSFQDKDFIEELLNRPASPETERIFARFLANSETDNVSNQSLVKQEQEQHLVKQEQEQHLVASINNNNNSNQTRLHQQQQQQQSNFSSGFYQSQAKPPLPDHNPMVTSLVKPPNLIRHSSSPAGLFSNINIDMENGFAVIGGMGDFRTGNRETSYSSASKPPASSLRMSPITETGNRSMIDNTPDSGGFEETPGNNYGTGFSVGAWHDAAAMADGIEGLTDDGRKLSGVNASENHRGDMGSRPPMLAHHLSLPKTSAELSAIEKYLQLQDSVPCKIRAKRGCATHPRSIAERVRRTRISERMRKLQDLVPNMDKQTNTSDMLDLAVDYIKDLQRQVKALSESRSRCACSSTVQQC